MRARIASILTALLVPLWGSAASAASLQVSPVLVQVNAPAKTTVVRLKNLAGEPLNAQVRIYKWVQEDGADKLVESTDVVASPPIATVKPNGEYVIRLVRMSKAPVAAEESYRLLIDEIPDTAKPKSSGISFRFRYSIPVFFGLKADAKPALNWSITNKGGKAFVTVRNDGDRRARLADMKVLSAAGTPVYARGGLVGYVLAGSTASWPLKGAKGLSQGSSVAIKALTEDGSLQTTIPVGVAQ